MAFKKIGVLVAGAVATVLSTAGTASTIESDAAWDGGSVSLARSELPSAWIVQFQTAPKVKGGAAARIAKEQSDFATAAAGEGIEYKTRRSFETLYNGVSVNATSAEAAKLAQLPGVQAVFPVIQFSAPEPLRGARPDVFNSIALSKVDQARATLGLTGKNVKVGIIDTGVDIDHPDLGGTGTPGGTPFPNGRIVAGYDFVGDAYDANPGNPTYNPIPSPDPNPDDCGGHGTHVAGIVGAKAGGPGGITGVAPDVKFGAYRVFGCVGSSDSDVIIAALERAYIDGMDIVNMSLGASYQWPQYPTAVVSDNLVDAGVVVVASAGNNGANGVYSLGAPGVGDKVIGVASFDNTKTGVAKALINNDVMKAFGYATLTFAPSPPTSGTSAEVVYSGRACNADSFPAGGEPSGKVALVTRGTCSFAEKYVKALNAGAVGVIIENNAPGIFFGTLGAPSGNIFGISVSQATGTAIKNASKPTTISWTNESIEEALPSAGLISSFSSYGLSPDLTMKPDVGAPGGFITSTYPLEDGGYAVLSGTSMSSPHTAGAVAMLLEKSPSLSAADVRTVLQNSADPKALSAAPSLGILDHSHRQGAGMIDVVKSANSLTSVSPAKLSLGESSDGPQTRTLTVRNMGTTAVTYTVTHRGAAATLSANGNGTHAPGLTSSALQFATASFSTPTIVVPAGGQTSVSVTITAPAALPDRSQYGGYIVFTPQGGGDVYRVPYAGFKGDYQSIQVLVPTANGFPWLAKADAAGNLVKQNAGAEFTMKRGDIAYVVAHFDHPSQLTKIDIVPLRQVGSARDLNVYTLPYFSRNSAPTTFFAFDWDGSAKVNGRRTPLPMGEYKLKLTVLKALGDPANPAHYETWESPVFKINRAAD